MSALGLSPEQIATRRKYVQAGDAARLMAGEWKSVWREKTGLAEGDDLSGVLPVQLGSMTEPFNLWWAEKTTGRSIEYFSDNPMMRAIWAGLRGEQAWMRELQVSETYPFMACNLDGMTTTPQGHRCVIDAKHLGQAYEQEILRYTAAGTHQATVMGSDWWALSCLIGNRKHEVIYQEIDPLYQARLIATEREFWGYVERGEEPEDRAEPKPAPKPQPKRREIILDLTPEGERPNWAGEFTRLARVFAETKGAADLHAITRKAIDELLPDDIGLARVGLVTAKRDGRGFSISLQKPEATDDR